MPNIQSAAKRARQNPKRRTANRFYRARARNAVKAANISIEARAPETPEAIRRATVALDKAARKRAIHANQAARTKSRLMRKWTVRKTEAVAG